MAVASDSRRRFVPRADERDSGDLPDVLRGVSFELAKFLRYEVHRRQLCDDDGWVLLDVLITELGKGGGGRSPLSVTEDQVQTVVASSYSKDKARFELRDYDSKSYIRAADREKYQNRSNRKFPGGSSATGARGNSGYSSKPPQSGGGWDQYRSSGSNGADQWRQNASSQNPKSDREFDGKWYREGTAICEINGTSLAWFDKHEKICSRQRIVLKAREITLLQHEDNAEMKGNLNSIGQLIWEDGDIWACSRTEKRQSASPSAGSTMASTGSSSSDAHLSTTASNGNGHWKSSEDPRGQASCFDIGGEPTNGVSSNQDSADWKEMRVLADWDASDMGDDYLSLKKGELLMVKASGDSPETEEGWAYGESVQKQKAGYFPPTYVQV